MFDLNLDLVATDFKTIFKFTSSRHHTTNSYLYWMISTLHKRQCRVFSGGSLND